MLVLFLLIQKFKKQTNKTKKSTCLNALVSIARKGCQLGLSELLNCCLNLERLTQRQAKIRRFFDTTEPVRRMTPGFSARTPAEDDFAK